MRVMLLVKATEEVKKALSLPLKCKSPWMT